LKKTLNRALCFAVELILLVPHDLGIKTNTNIQ